MSAGRCAAEVVAQAPLAPSTCVFDVNETLLDIEFVAPSFRRLTRSLALASMSLEQGSSASSNMRFLVASAPKMCTLPRGSFSKSARGQLSGEKYVVSTATAVSTTVSSRISRPIDPVSSRFAPGALAASDAVPRQRL
jgi:hypothetical protein